MTIRLEENETEKTIVLIKKHWQAIQNVKAIPGDLKNALVVADIDNKIRNVVRKICNERRKISLLKDVKIRKAIEKVIELDDAGAPNLRENFKDGVLKVCDEVCRKKRERRSKGDTWWMNETVKDALSRKMHTR